MKNNPIYEDLSFIFSRARWTFNIIVALFVILVLLFWKTQILDYQKFWKRSEANRIREIVLPSQRGSILDRDGIILSKNIGSFKASIIRENCVDFNESYQKITHLLGLPTDVLKERIDKYKSLPPFRPIVIKDNLSQEEVSQIEARKLELSELIVQTESKRFYPFSSLAAHVIGYLLEVSPEELKTDSFSSKRIGDLVGKTGIERVYESQLTGEDGQVLEIVDSIGRKTDEIARQKPLPGENVWLTLDYELQKKAEELLEGREGAVVVLNPKNGQVLALASYPNFDPNKFINRFTPQEWRDIIDSPEFPLENRAIRGLYSPGSIFKLTMALGALDSRIITDRTTFFCGGQIRIYNRYRSCWYGPGHGALDIASALKNSCNIYFYQLGQRMGIEEIALYARMLGFESKTGIDLDGEKDGLVPDPDWKKRARNARWFPGETISVAIGQGPLLVTPLQIASHTALIANRGERITPLLVKAIGQTPYSYSNNGQISPKDRPQIEKSIFEKVIKGMWMSVNEGGTSAATRIKDFDVCGKTGSTQVISSEQAKRLAQQNIEIKTHSWFSGFAPREDPKVVVTVLVEYGGGGGATAAPLARALFELYKERYD